MFLGIIFGLLTIKFLGSKVLLGKSLKIYNYFINGLLSLISFPSLSSPSLPLSLSLSPLSLSLAVSMVVSALSTFAIWGVPKRVDYIVILSCVFTGFSTIGWIALDVIIPELFAVHLR